MRRYRTEIVIPADRTIVLHLPDDLPEGPAALVVQIEEPAVDGMEAEDDLADLLDPKEQDIEWWEEFEDATR